MDYVKNGTVLKFMASGHFGDENIMQPLLMSINGVHEDGGDSYGCGNFTAYFDSRIFKSLLSKSGPNFMLEF